MFGRRTTPPLMSVAKSQQLQDGETLVRLPAIDGEDLPSIVTSDIANNNDPAHAATELEDHVYLEPLSKTNYNKLDAHLIPLKETIHSLLLEQIDLSKVFSLPMEEIRLQVVYLIEGIIIDKKMTLSQSEQQAIADEILDDMLGLGPLEPLLKDEQITDILVNTPDQVYVERQGRLERTNITFRDNDHVTTVARRIVTTVGRRIDETSPLCDARLPDGSRVNVAIAPCVLKGTTISIRKFAKKKITLDSMVASKNMSLKMANFLKTAGAIRLNILISGGTGSGKTTLLNAISQHIHPGERIITIEDAAELKLQQPHIVSMETRNANLEGDGEISMRDLLKNALRMRPDRIILGEVRGPEAYDMLQAMNTGHDGSLGTLHSNSPRDSLARLENMIITGGINMPSKVVRSQIASSVNLIVHVNRMHDGLRRITHITEVVGMENDVLITHDLFTFQVTGEDENTRLVGEFCYSGIRPHFTPKAIQFGKERELLQNLLG